MEVKTAEMKNKKITQERIVNSREKNSKKKIRKTRPVALPHCFARLEVFVINYFAMHGAIDFFLTLLGMNMGA